MNAAEFVSRLGPDARPKHNGNGSWVCRCPAHEDRNASLSVKEKAGGGALVHCHAGCTADAVVAAVGLKLADLMPPRTERTTSKEIVATYPYTDEAGALLFEALRYEPKDFRQRRPDGKGGWIFNLQETRRVLFRLPEVIAAVKAGRAIYVCEGEKDVLALVARHLDATCNPMGAGKWRAEFADVLAGADVCIIADRDEPGRKHAAQVAASLHSKAASVRVIECPDVNGTTIKDAADFLAAGGNGADLLEIASSGPLWMPTCPSKIATVEATGPEGGDGFDKITADVRGEILNILTDANCKGSARNRAVAKVAVGALAKAGRLYFHAERRDFDSAMFFDATAKRLLRIQADAFGSWFSEWLGINRADPLFKFAMAEVETAALAGAQTTGILPESFWTARPGAIYLSTGDGTLAKITAAGVTLADNGSDGVLFASGRTLAPWKLTEPRDAFETCALFRNAHCNASHAPDLVRLWLYSLPSSPPSKPPLCLAGDIGSGKTRLAKGFAELYGLPFVAQKVEESAEDDFWPCVDAGGIFTLDNADTKCRWLADALANAATDGCSQRRRLYTNSETVVLRARAWLAVTTSNATFAADSGLADRLLLVRMGRRDGEETSDGALTDEILANRDAGLSHIAQTLRTALADKAPAPSGLNKRHPDFATFAVRIGRALGREAEAVAALKTAEQDKSAFCLENDAIGAALLSFLRAAQTFNGTAAELAPHLIAVDGDLDGRLSAKRLGKRLSALWPHLQSTLATARRDPDRNGVAVFTLKTPEPAGFAGFQTAFP